MGTLFEVLLGGDDEEHLAAVAEALLDEVVRVERLLSRFDPKSEIARVNRQAGREPVLVDREVAALLALCLEAREWSGGCFDIATQNGARTVAVEFDPAARRIAFRTQTRLDLGGVGKGYALERAAELLSPYRVEHALLHGGTSSVLARGRGPDGGPWRIDLRDPAGGGVSRWLELNDEALSCSWAGEAQDIMDPRSGEAVRRKAGCAVVAPSATLAEILSTALVVRGPEGSAALAAAQGGPRARVHWLSATEDSA
jgi:thiamine biosynthesis lipoprotein